MGEPLQSVRTATCRARRWQGSAKPSADGRWLAGRRHRFVQDGRSRSAASGTVSVSIQNQPHEQGKLIRFCRAVLDVALDMRPDSPTFLEHTTIELREDDQRALWVPPGFAHGFCTLEPNTTIAYRVTGYYNREAERAIRWDDPELAIPWPVRPEEAVLSEKDASAPSFAEFQRRD